ncbi:IS21 family transposase [Corynebacterium canis]|uniref:IS21 family transposase n=1 Tax=Corynebacterium canis TaxID=679663 RepID=A0A5C5TS72_9CORY|nr:IS21 family transposase [Corynebacterium canis]TWT16864.1 IS21 family transposase [Corynebacterium canis]WJY74551.1 Integrase core domain protein [Corynebacterium canis]WJY75348.1 Integrase core domain protein [Corynebacterium canis]
MVDYRKVMRLALDKVPYRVISAQTGAAPATISKAVKAMASQGITSVEQIRGLSDEDLARIVGDRRRAVSDKFVPIDMDAVIAARTGRKKTPLNVLWASYVEQPAPIGLRHYSYERFRQIVAADVASRGFTARIVHSPGATMQVDWAGTKMHLKDPVTGKRTRVSIFVATLPYSGMIFATGRLDERQHNWHEAHRLAFEYFGGVAEVIVPDNAATATNSVHRSGRGPRRINDAYEEFLAHYGTAAYATPAASPTYKGNVEAGVKVVSSRVIGKLKNRSFAWLDDLNAAIAAQVDAINDHVPFRDQQVSRRQIFTECEASFLGALPARPYEPVQWRKSKVAPNWHITFDTAHYSVPYTLIGSTVDVRIRGMAVDVFHDGALVAQHAKATRRGAYSTEAELHGPPGLEVPGNLWSADYFRSQASRIGPATRRAMDSLLASRPIIAQAYQPARSILSLGKGDNKGILELACQRLTAGDKPRAVSYTAVKTMMAAIRAEAASRPEASTRSAMPDDRQRGSQTALPLLANRNGMLGGADQFRLGNLTTNPGVEQQEGTTR